MGAAELEPEAFEPLYALLVAGESPYAATLRREAESYDLTLSAPQHAALASTPKPNRVGVRLPQPLTQLVGRVNELAELTRLLGQPEVRLLSLLGLGGVGKTRLALELARTQADTFKDGAFFLALDQLDTPERFPELLARALDLDLGQAEDAEAEVARFLENKRLLLLLDGAETVVEVGGLLSRLLSLSPGLKMLLTTRERFGLADEWGFRLEGLPVPAAETPLTEALEAAAAFFLKGNAARAAGLLSAAEHARGTFGIPRPPLEQGRYTRHLAEAKATLGDGAFEAAWRAGQQLRLEAAVTYALATQIASGARER